MSNDGSARTRRNQLYGLLVLCIILLPMLLAYLIFKTGWGMPSETTNKGDLLSPPISLKKLVLSKNGELLDNLYPASPKKWRILVPVTQSCDANCEDFLYISRQVHIRLAEKAYRVERILLLLDEFSPEELLSLKQQHPGTLIFYSRSADLANWLAATGLPKAADQYFYLIDQEGFAMMRYGSSHSGQDLLDDLKKLLKFTYDK